MKTLTSFTTLAGALILAFSLSGNLAHATPIDGTINFDGEATTNSGNLATATSFTSIIGTMVVPQETGSYAAIPAVTPVTFTPFTFSAAGVTPLWTLTLAGITYSFNATSIVVDAQNANFLNISGTGIASITGYTNTAGTWSITDTSVGGSPTFTFGADSVVPDSGITALLILLGLAGVGLGVLAQRRKLAQAAA
jgi:hypothetical protein